MKNVKVCAGILSLAAAASILIPKEAKAYQYITQDLTWHFTSANGHCDSLNSSCSVVDATTWFTGGRAGYDNAWGNGYLWLSNDDNAGHWDSWNTFFNPQPSPDWQTVGECSIDASVYAPTYSTVGEMDVWYQGSGGGLVLLGSEPISGTNNAWSHQFFSSIRIDPVLHGSWAQGLLVVFGRHPGETGGEFIAFDDVHVRCTTM